MLLIIAMTSLALPPHSARAALVTTETVIGEAAQTETGRDRIRAFLQRKELQAQLAAYGVDPREALDRVESMSDQEVARIVARIDQLPAGGELENVYEEMATILALGLVLLAILGLVWIVKLIVD